MEGAAAAVAILACTLFAGAAIYISFVEHPARLSCGTEIAFRQWAPSYRRGAVMQVLLALTATAAGIASWAVTREGVWLWGTLAIFSVIPYTLLVVFPTNNRLQEPGRDPASAETGSLLEAWGRLHGVRSLLGAAASILYAVAALSS